jgi:replicative DNA helicase
MAFSSEKALLSVCLRDPVAVDEAVSLGIKKDHFDHPYYRILWGQFTKDRTAGIGPDRATLFDRFADRIGKGKSFESYDAFGTVISSIEMTPGSRKNVETYVAAVVQSARRKHIVRLANMVIACDADNEPFSELLRHSASIASVTTWSPEGRSAPRLAHDITKDYLEDLEAQRLGLRTNTLIASGIESLDNILRVRPGQMIVVGGRPKMGKTHLMISVLRNIAQIQNRPTLFVSAEMNEMQIGERIASSEANLGSSAEEVQRARGGILDAWRDVPIYFDDKPKSLGAALMSIRVQKKQLDISAAAIDYLQLLKLPQSTSRERQVAEASSAFKRLSMELDIPVFVVAQLNRSCEFRENKRPILSDLRDSGQIEQDADAVVFVYRHGVYDSAYEDSDEAEVIVRAQRNGPTGTSLCRWKPGRGWFADRIHG